MNNGNLEERLASLEEEVAKLKGRIEAIPPSPQEDDPWERVYGAFANDPDFEEAMRLGREYRESLRPKSRAPAKRKKQQAKHATKRGKK